VRKRFSGKYSSRLSFNILFTYGLRRNLEATKSFVKRKVCMDENLCVECQSRVKDFEIFYLISFSCLTWFAQIIYKKESHYFGKNIFSRA